MNIKNLYERLYNYFGDNGSWWPATNEYEIIVGCILTQNTTWTNVEKSLKNFPNFKPQTIEKMPIEKLIELIRPSGFFNQKAVYLKEVTNWYKKYDYNKENVKKIDTDILRKELLSVKGIGNETADSILLYAFNKKIMVIDAYTLRVFNRLGLIKELDYLKTQKLIMSHVDDTNLYKKFHGFIVDFAKDICKKTPDCQNCFLKENCKFYKDL